MVEPDNKTSAKHRTCDDPFSSVAVQFQQWNNLSLLQVIHFQLSMEQGYTQYRLMNFWKTNFYLQSFGIITHMHLPKLSMHISKPRWKLTYPLIFDGWKVKIPLFKPSLFRGYVNFPGGFGREVGSPSDSHNGVMSNVQQENCSLERGPGVDSLWTFTIPKGKKVICITCLLIILQVFLVSFEGCIYIYMCRIYKAFSPMPSIQNMVCQCRYHMDGRVSRKVGERSSRW